MFVTVEEVQSDLDVLRSHACRIIRNMNEEFKKRRYLIITGHVRRKYYEERLYGGTNVREGCVRCPLTRTRRRGSGAPTSVTPTDRKGR